MSFGTYGTIDADVLPRIQALINSNDIVPDKKDIFRAFYLTPISELKVVIIGQDPYYTKGVADGLAFSTRSSKIPKSLENIYKEIKREYGSCPKQGDLTYLARQGVLLLNTRLTATLNKPLSKEHNVWEKVIDKVIKYISDSKNNIVFLLWGNNAKSKEQLIDQTKHCVLKSGHPSPLSFKLFYGNNHFRIANQHLKNNKIQEISWSKGE